MSRRWVVFLLLLLIVPAAVHAQQQPPSEFLTIDASSAFTWSEEQTGIILAQGPVHIVTDRAQMWADDVVLWLSPDSAAPGQQQLQIALLGHVIVQTDDVQRTGDRLLVDLVVRGSIRISAQERLARNLSSAPLYRQALALRVYRVPTTPLPPATAPASPTTVPTMQLRAQFGQLQTVLTEEGHVAAVMTDGVTLLFRRAPDLYAELRASRAVLYTTLRSLREAQNPAQWQDMGDVVQAVYLEGDVRITATPTGRAPQSLSANRAYYELQTDRAVLTDVVIHAMDPNQQVPIIVRAEKVRQLAQGDFRARGVELSTSAFATPSYSLRADKAYVRQVDTGNERLGTRTNFSASNTTLNLFGVPFFYLPLVGGSVTERGLPLRQAQLSSSSIFGFGVRTEWGLMETLGQPSPDDLDLRYRADWFSDRGPAGGIDGDYAGGFITEASRQPWTFDGKFRTYFVQDHGVDELGRKRLDVEPPDEFRGRMLWEHQQFFPGGWQVQLRGAYVSDATFLEQWFPRQWHSDEPSDDSVYVKRQDNIEAFTLLGNYQPNDFVTSSAFQQEQAEVQHLPEAGYHRIGDSWGDHATFFSTNTASALSFQNSEASLREQGFATNQSPGIPSYGQTGTPEGTTYRGYFREELNRPLTLGKFKALPYVMGTYLPYSDSPDGDAQHRLYAGTGMRLTTQFWKVDDTVQSDLFDLHRMRHIVEPSAHLYTSVQDVEPTDVYIYDEQVDRTNDISAANFAVKQRWQTKRGGPGRWRNVDFFTLNTEATFFANQPEDSELNPQVRDPRTGRVLYDATGFRGLYFQSLPEASIPRNSLNADALWRISDTTVLLPEASYNLDEQKLATAALGLAVQRDLDVTWFLSTRYIGPLDSNVVTAAILYRLSTKYSLGLSQSYDFGAEQTVGSRASVIRRFDRFAATFTLGYNNTTGESSANFSIAPQGMEPLAVPFASDGLFQ